MTDVQQVLDTLLHALQGVPGIAAVVLGGSRARGAATPASDTDLGLYYEPGEPPDLAALRQVAARMDDQRSVGAVTTILGRHYLSHRATNGRAMPRVW